jgi:hypothetical protein
MESEYELCYLSNHKGDGRDLLGYPDYFNVNYRVWLREPTPAELAANPWPA